MRFWLFMLAGLSACGEATDSTASGLNGQQLETVKPITITVPRQGELVFEDEFAHYNAVYPSDGTSMVPVFVYDKAIPVTYSGKSSNLTVGDSDYKDVQVAIFGESAIVSIDCGNGPGDVKADPFRLRSLGQAAIDAPGAGPDGSWNAGERINGANPTIRDVTGELYQRIGARVCAARWKDLASSD